MIEKIRKAFESYRQEMLDDLEALRHAPADREDEETEEHESYDKFIENYLPKTVSAIEHYRTLCNLNNLDHEEERIKAQFENSLAMLADAFSNILNRVSTEGLLDISTDITVLENILKQEGLADSDFPS